MLYAYFVGDKDKAHSLAQQVLGATPSPDRPLSACCRQGTHNEVLLRAVGLLSCGVPRIALAHAAQR